MAITENELIIKTLRRLDERYGSTIGEVVDSSGAILSADGTTWVTGSGTSLTTLVTMRDMFNAAAVEWCRTAYLYDGKATLTWATTRHSARFTEFTPTAQGNVWSVEQMTRTVGSTTTTLPRMGRGELRTHYPEYRTTSSTPAYWAQDGAGVVLSCKPTVEFTSIIYGPSLPLSISDSNTSWSWMEDEDLWRIIPLMAAIFLVRRKFTSPDMFGRLEEMVTEYSDLYTQWRSRLDPATLAQHYTFSPNPELLKK